jgi:cytosine/adenosine deaminase-related metal-dependent hydrolase
VTKAYGSLEPGERADLVVLARNRLTAIGNTRRTQAVVRRGRVIEAAEIGAMLEGVRAEVGGAVNVRASLALGRPGGLPHFVIVLSL